MAITAKFIADFDAFIKSTRDAELRVKDLEKSGKDLGKSFDAMKGSVTELAGAFGITFSVGALVAFAKEAIATAAKMGDLAAATGVTTDSLQRLAFVGQGFGVDVDEMSRAVGNLSTRLASGDASAVSAVQSLGLNVGRLIASGPTEAFLDIADSAGRVEDPMSKAAIASALFGDKLAKVLIPALGDLRTKMAEVPQDAIISKATIDSANEFEASIKHGVTRLEAWAAKILFAWSEGSRATAAAAKVQAEATTAQEDLSAAQEHGITNINLLENRLKALREQAVEPLTKAQKATAGELLFYGEAQKEVARLLGVSESAIKLYTEAEKAASEEMKRASVEAEKFADIINDISLKALKNSQTEFDAWSARLTITTDRITAAILKESEAQTVLNASHGLTALGANKVASAEETLRLGLEALHRTKEGSIAQTAQEQLLYNAYTKELRDAAIATDTVNRSIGQVPAVAGAASVAINGLTRSYWSAVDAAAALSGIPSIGHRSGEPGSELHAGASPNLSGVSAGFSLGGGAFTSSSLNNGGLHPLRDMGGPVSAGSTYLIGKGAQPELFTPGASGFMTPNGGGPSVNVTIYVNGTAADVARQVSAEILKTVKQATKLGSA
jgi:predicted transcriptional regulator